MTPSPAVDVQYWAAGHTTRPTMNDSSRKYQAWRTNKQYSRVGDNDQLSNVRTKYMVWAPSQNHYVLEVNKYHLTSGVYTFIHLGFQHCELCSPVWFMWSTTSAAHFLDSIDCYSLRPWLGCQPSWDAASWYVAFLRKHHGTPLEYPLWLVCFYVW